MSGFPGSPRLIRGGIVLLDPDTSQVKQVIALQYNPDTLTRTLQIQGAGQESGDRLETLRLKGPPIETIKLDAEIDATDQLEFPDRYDTVAEFGIHPQLATLESIIYPSSATLTAHNDEAKSGNLEIAPIQAPLTLFIWSASRVIPVRITDFSITEEAFDTALNPIRAKVSLGMRVMTVMDLGFDHRGGNLFMAYLQKKEQLSRRSQAAGLNTLGITRIP
jgi:hypothetical protein